MRAAKLRTAPPFQAKPARRSDLHHETSVRIVLPAQEPVQVEICLLILVSPLVVLQMCINLSRIHPPYLRHLMIWALLGTGSLQVALVDLEPPRTVVNNSPIDTW